MDGKAADLLVRLSEAFRTDGWANPFTGLGTTRDKTTHSTFSRGEQLTDEELESLYAENDMAARICDALPEDALRRGFEIKIQTDKDAERERAARGDDTPPATELADVGEAAEIAAALHARFEELGLADKLIEGWIWGRVFGWGALVLGVDDGQELSAPLREDAIRSFTHANVLDKRFVAPLTWYTDPTAPNHGRPQTYLVTAQAIQQNPTASRLNYGDRIALARQQPGGAQEIHESRLVIFDGVRTTIRRRQERSGFSDSLLQRVYTPLRQFGVSWDSLSNILQDAYQGVYKMEGLISLLAANDKATVQQRFALMDMGRSAVRALVLDAEHEDFERHTTQWSGVDKVMELFMLRLSSAARMPVTIMLGQAPAGMNATGESDLTWWYDTVDTARTGTLEPRLRRIVTLLALVPDGPTAGQVPESWDIAWPKLWTPTEKEAAEIRYMQAQTDKIYGADMNVVTESEIARSRFPATGWSGETQIDLAAREAIADEELDELGPKEEEPVPAPGQAPKPPAGA